MQPKHWINNGGKESVWCSNVCGCISLGGGMSSPGTSPLYLLPLHGLENKECPPQGHSLCTRRCSDMEWHISVVDHKTTRLCIVLSAHGSTQAKCIRSNGRIQIRSNTKGARTGRNTNTSILVATDMHATETLNQQWKVFEKAGRWLLPNKKIIRR